MLREKVIGGIECCPRHCGLCSYFHEECEGGQALKRDALKVLRGERARVLSVEEYRAIAEQPAEERVPVWLEWLYMKEPGRYTIPERAYSGYGHTWRCWNVKPAEEQRKAEKWEERPLSSPAAPVPPSPEGEGMGERGNGREGAA